MIESRYIDWQPDGSTTVTYTTTTGRINSMFCPECGREMFQELNVNKLGDWICINCETKVIDK
jgi:hypothetical protein